MMKRAEPQTVRSRPSTAQLNFLSRDSLLRTVVFATIIISLFPVLVYGTVSYYRSRAQVQSLVSSQLANITSSGAQQLTDFAANRKNALDRLVGEETFSSLLVRIARESQSGQTIQDAQSLRVQQFLSGPAAASGETLFQYMVILDPGGNILISNNTQWERSTFAGVAPAQHPAITAALARDANQAAFLYDPFPPFQNQFALLLEREFSSPALTGKYTVLTFSTAPVAVTVLKQAAGFFPGARAFYYVEGFDGFLGAGAEPALSHLPQAPAILAAISPSLTSVGNPQPLHYVSYNQTAVLAYVKNVSDLNLSLVLEVPTQNLYGQIPVLDMYNLLMIVFSVIILAGFAYLGTTQIVNPLLQLNQIARGLANGDFKLRVQIDRRDEIGQLAESMNRLGVELGVLSSSMEGKVDQRTAQLATASEIASLAASYTTLEEVSEKTVSLINEHFNFYHTAILLVDETGTALVLQSASGESAERIVRRKARYPFSEKSSAGEVAQTNKARLINDLSDPIKDLPDARAMALVPISNPNKVFGVLEVYSQRVDDFDADTLFVLQSLANQVAAALQNAHLHSTEQVDPEENAFLYGLARQIVEAADEKLIVDLVLKALPQFQHTCAFIDFHPTNLHILGLYDDHTKKFEGFLNRIDIPTAHYYEEIAAGIPIFVQNIAQPNNYDNVLSFFLRRGCASAVIIPSMHNGSVTKLLILGFYETEYVNQARLQPYYFLADMITTALDRSNALNQLRERLTNQQMLASFSSALALEDNLDDIYRVMHEHVIKILGADVGFLIAIGNPKTGMIEIPYAYENNQIVTLAPLPPGQGLIAYIMQQKEALLLSKDAESRAIEMGAHIVGKPARSWMGVPLIAGSQIIGALVFQDHQNENRFNENDLNLFTALASQISSAIRSVELSASLAEANRAYARHKEWVDTWLSNTQDLVMVKNAHGQITRASQSALKAFQLDPGQMAGKSDFDIFPQDIALQSAKEEIQLMSDQKAKFESQEQLAINGKTLWFSTTKLAVVGENGSTTGILNIRRNINAQKLAEQEAQRRAEQILNSAEIARVASSSLNVQELINNTLPLIKERFDFQHVAIYLTDSNGNLVVRPVTGQAADPAVGSAICPDAVRQAAERSEVILTHDAGAAQLSSSPETTSHAEAALPLKFNGRLLGILDIHSAQAAPFSGETLGILAILADQLAIAIDNASLVTGLRDMISKHHLLHEITVAASTGASLEASLSNVTDRLVAARAADRAAVFILRGGVLDAAAAHGYQEEERTAALAMGKTFSAIAMKTKQPVHVNDASSNGSQAGPTGAIISQLALPIRFGEEILGVLNLESTQSTAFGESDREIFNVLVNTIAAVIANWRLVFQVRQQVERQEILFNATAKIRHSVDVPTILQTSVSEIGRAIGAKAARITLAPIADASDPISPSPGNSGQSGVK